MEGNFTDKLFETDGENNFKISDCEISVGFEFDILKLFDSHITDPATREILSQFAYGADVEFSKYGISRSLKIGPCTYGEDGKICRNVLVEETTTTGKRKLIDLKIESGMDVYENGDISEYKYAEVKVGIFEGGIEIISEDTESFSVSAGVSKKGFKLSADITCQTQPKPTDYLEVSDELISLVMRTQVQEGEECPIDFELMEVEEQIYNIRKGDTISALAQKWGVSVADILSTPGNEWLAERTSADGRFILIKPEERLHIPANANMYTDERKIPQDIQKAMNEIASSESIIPAPPKRDPLVLDLSGDGIPLIPLGNSTVHFDMDGDAIAERTAWVGPQDGLLAVDANGNGRIDGVGEFMKNFGTSIKTDIIVNSLNQLRVA